MYRDVLKTLIAVVEKGGFSKAANSLFISSVSVMKQINNFEQEIGFKIFKRTPRGVKLTPAGQDIYIKQQKNDFIFRYGNSASQRSC